MKTKITKLNAAKLQLVTCINLFFEEGDAVSIHTLVGAVLGILYEGIDEDFVRKHGLILHPKTPWIKEESRKEYINLVNSFRNFFKHSGRDIKMGVNEIEFNPTLNEFFISDAVQAMRIISPDYMVPEIVAFRLWFVGEHPNCVPNSSEYSDFIQSNALKTKRDFKEMIDRMKTIPKDKWDHYVSSHSNLMNNNDSGVFPFH